VTLKKPPGGGDKLCDWGLLPSKPNWAKGFAAEWTPGEDGARARLEAFLKGGLEGYTELRNRPDLPNVSRLSPHLHFGEISPRQVWAMTQHFADAHAGVRRDADKFLSEVGWREFAHHLLYHFPTLPERNWKPAFDAYPWQTNAKHLAAWQRGQTGYPIVDAGLRELWATGYMHNRVRMVVASFLIKHLRIDWRQGEAWFWDTLVDADLANNAASWQWVAGSGADAAPYFRIFNPMEQGRKFDPEGVYIRRWCPELAKLPNDALFAPFEALPMVLAAAGVVLGKTYPQPLVVHAEARAAALAGYQAVKGAG
jgi:deoxyribodipyrimidine photo-lyase